MCIYMYCALVRIHELYSLLAPQKSHGQSDELTRMTKVIKIKVPGVELISTLIIGAQLIIRSQHQLELISTPKM